jgi:hypothetical protein
VTTKLRTLLGLLAAAFGTSVQAAPAESIRVVDYGLYAITRQGHHAVPGVITGAIDYLHTLHHLDSTRSVPGRVGVTFGFRYVLQGAVGEIPLTIVMHYPEPGARDPTTGLVHHVDRYTESAIAGSQTGEFYSLDTMGEIVTGRWTLEVWDGGRKLASQDFWIEPGASS